MAVGSSHLAPQLAKLTLVRGFAMQINHTEWEELRAAGIVARARIKIDFSTTHRRFVLCAEESGGATDKVGHYCGFLPLSGDPTFFVRPVTLAMPNTEPTSQRFTVELAIHCLYRPPCTRRPAL